MSSKSVIRNGLIFGGLVFAGMLAGCAQMQSNNKPQPGPNVVSAEKVSVASTSAPPLLPTPPLPPLQLKEGYPVRYTVQPGDTVWTVAELYLDNPWRWHELWRDSETEKLFPGEIIELDFVSDRPVLRLVEGERSTIKLSPEVRVEYINQEIPTITQDAVQAFVDNSVVSSEADWKGAPYIISSADGRNIMQTGAVVYARGAEFDQAQYGVYRPEGELRDPDSNTFLGFSLIYVGEASLDEEGDPARLVLESTRQPVRAGDRLLPSEGDDGGVFSFDPVAAPPDSFGQIIKLPNGEITAPRYATVIVNLGNLDGMRPGSVLEVIKDGGQGKDPLTGELVQLPGERAGFLVLYRVFDRVSYGLVTNAKRPIRVADRVREPS